MRVDVGAEAHIPGVLTVIAVAAHIVDIVVGEVPLFERTEGQAGAGQLIDRETRLDFHEHRRTVVENAVGVAVAHAEEVGQIEVAVKIEPVFFREGFIFQIDVVIELRSEAGVIAAHHVDALVPPVGEVLRIAFGGLRAAAQGGCQQGACYQGFKFHYH